MSEILWILLKICKFSNKVLSQCHTCSSPLNDYSVFESLPYRVSLAFKMTSIYPLLLVSAYYCISLSQNIYDNTVK